MSRQLILDLPHRVALSRDDFLVTPSNAQAVALVDQYPDWPSPAVMIVGGEGSGKSHLGQVFREMTGAPRISADELTIEEVPDLMSNRACLVEDLHLAARNETALFHLYNLARQTKGSLLLTSRLGPSDLAISLPDLRSRLQSIPIGSILPPDDALLRAVLVKHFVDRQVDLHTNVIEYLIQRMPRSLGVARMLVDELDRLALSEKTQITRPLAARVLASVLPEQEN